MPTEGGLTKEQFTTLVNDGLTTNMTLQDERNHCRALTLNHLIRVADVIVQNPDLTWPNQRDDETIQDNREGLRTATEASIANEEAKEELDKLNREAVDTNDAAYVAAVKRVNATTASAHKTAWDQGWMRQVVTPKAMAEAKTSHETWSQDVKDRTEAE